MEQTLVRPGEESGWGPEPIVAVVVAGAVYVTTDVGLVVAALGTLGLLFAYGGLRSAWQLLALRSVEREPIGSLLTHSGAVEVDGTARAADRTVTAPMTGTESVAYSVEVSRWEPTREES